MPTFLVARRSFLLTSVAVALAPVARAFGITTDSTPELRAIESRLGGRLGVVAIDTANGARVAYRQDDRFPMCSTFKLLAVAATLAQVEAGKEKLDRIVEYGDRDLLDYAPVAKAHVREGRLSVAALCAAAIEQSDNTAANLLLAKLGGPTAVTQYARSLGDATTHLDRNEPTLNSAQPGDERDTTTPAGMLGNLRALMLGNALQPASRDRLREWLLASTTGTAKLRAGLPPSWRVGDKTGAGENGASGDIAIAWPPDGRAPVLIAMYMVGSSESMDRRNAAFAEVARIVATRFA